MPGAGAPWGLAQWCRWVLCVCVLLARCPPCPLWLCGTWQQRARVPLPPFPPCPGSLQTAGNNEQPLSAVIPRRHSSFLPLPYFFGRQLLLSRY